MSDTTDLTVREDSSLMQADGVAALKNAEGMVRYMAEKCKGPKYISVIQGNNYPRVDWWTTVGGGLSVFPRQEGEVKRIERDGEIVYEATVGLYRGDLQVGRGSAICSNKEKGWNVRDEHAVRSMALTRAVGKAFRMSFSFLAVMAGLEPTPAEEMPQTEGEQEERKFYTCPKCGKETVIKGAPQYGGGYVCWKKKGGCGAKFGENDPQITVQDLPTEPGPDLDIDDCMKLELDLNDLLIQAEGRLMQGDIDTLRAGMEKHKGDIAWFAKAIAATNTKMKEQEALLTANVEGATIQGSKQPEIF